MPGQDAGRGPAVAAAAASGPWVVVATAPEFGSEARAKRDLEGRGGYECYLPRCIEPNRQRVAPLFPGYVFVRLDPRVEPWQPILRSRGVVDLVRFGDMPPTLSDDVVRAIRRKENRDGIVVIELQPGDRVEVLDGPFSGQHLEFVVEATADHRVRLLLDILGRSVRFEAEKRGVRKLGTGPSS